MNNKRKREEHGKVVIDKRIKEEERMDTHIPIDVLYLVGMMFLESEDLFNLALVCKDFQMLMRDESYTIAIRERVKQRKSLRVWGECKNNVQTKIEECLGVKDMDSFLTTLQTHGYLSSQVVEVLKPSFKYIMK